MGRNMQFLFWNICKRPENIELITKFGQSIGADIIAVCENDSPIHCELHGYRVIGHIDNSYEFAILARPGLSISYTMESKHFCLAFIEGELSINLAIVHFNSPIYSTAKSKRMTDTNKLLRALQIQECTHNSNRTIILGDFNVNPFDEILTDFNYLNTVYFKCSIGDGVCKQHGEINDIFYNPMIHILRDSEDACLPKGSYYYANRWYCYDQVFMKKPIAEQVDYNSVKFISEFSEGLRLVEDNKIISSISDHLPLYFELGCKEG